MQELERYGAQLDRQSRKELQRLNRLETVERGRIETLEALSAAENSTRLVNGALLTGQAQQHLTGLDAHSKQATRDKPGLEMQHQALTDVYAMGAAQLIHGYMSRKKLYS